MRNWDQGKERDFVRKGASLNFKNSFVIIRTELVLHLHLHPNRSSACINMSFEDISMRSLAFACRMMSNYYSLQTDNFDYWSYNNFDSAHPSMDRLCRISKCRCTRYPYIVPAYAKAYEMDTQARVCSPWWNLWLMHPWSSTPSQETVCIILQHWDHAGYWQTREVRSSIQVMENSRTTSCACGKAAHHIKDDSILDLPSPPSGQHLTTPLAAIVSQQLNYIKCSGDFISRTERIRSRQASQTRCSRLFICGICGLAFLPVPIILR